METESSSSKVFEKHTVISQAVKLEPGLEEDQETDSSENIPLAPLQVKIEPELHSSLNEGGNSENSHVSNPEEEPSPFLDVSVKVEPSYRCGTVTPSTQGTF